MMVCMVNVTFDAKITTQQMLAPDRPKPRKDDPRTMVPVRLARRSSSRNRAQNIATGQQPMAVAVNETTNKAYVVNHNSNSVTVIDGKTRTAVATIPTGAGPEGIAVNPVTNRIYVANSGENSVTVIDGATDTVIATVRTGSYCQAVAVNPVTNRIYVANNYRPQRHGDRRRHPRDGHGPGGPGSARHRREPGHEQDLHRELRQQGRHRDRRRHERRHPDPHGQASLGDRGRHAAPTRSTSSTRTAPASRSSTAPPARPRRRRRRDPVRGGGQSQANRAYVLTYDPEHDGGDRRRYRHGDRTVPLPRIRRRSRSTRRPTRSTSPIRPPRMSDARRPRPTPSPRRTAAGAIPYAMAVDTAANQVYVANFSGGNATVIDVPAASSRSGRAPPKFRVAGAGGARQRRPSEVRRRGQGLPGQVGRRKRFHGGLHHRHRADQ